MYGNMELNPTKHLVPYGTKVKAIIETKNMVGKALELELYKAKNLNDYSYNTQQIIKPEQEYTVNSDGKVIVDYVLDIKWSDANYFYVGAEKDSWLSYFTDEFNSKMVMGYCDGDRLSDGVKVYGKINEKSDTKTIAQFLLDEGRVTFSDVHSSGKEDQAYAIQNIKDLAAGKKTKLSYYNNRRNGGVF